MKKITRSVLALNKETIRRLTGNELRIAVGGLIPGGTSGEPECPTTVGYPTSCECNGGGGGGTMLICPGDGSQMPACDP